MAVDLVKENIECEQLLGENTSDTVIKAEYIIPDTLPDVFEILMLDAIPSIISKEVIQDKVYLEGQVEYNLIYLSRDEESSNIYNVSYTGKFSNYIEIDGAIHKMLCETECFVEHFDCSIINERKIAIEGIINVKAEVYKVYNFEIIKDVKNAKDMQFLKSPAAVDKVVGTVQGDLVAKAHIQIPMEKPQIGSILKYNVNIHKKEVTIYENKVQIEAFANIGVLYKAMDSREINYVEEDVFMNTEAELEGAESSMDCFTDFNLDAVAIDVKQDDLGENRILDLEALVKSNTRVMHKVEMDMIEDAYSPDEILNMDKKNYELNVMQGHATGETVVKGNIDVHDMPRPVQVLLCDGKVSVSDKKIVEDKVLIEGIINMEVMYKTQDDLKYIYTVNEDFPFNCSVDIPGSKIDMQCIAKVYIEAMEAAIEGGTVAIKAILSVMARVNYTSNKDFLVDLIPSDNEVPKKKASITIYAVQPGDTLWKIAKKYYTTVDSLLAMNEIENPEYVKNGDKLIIPGRAVI